MRASRLAVSVAAAPVRVLALALVALCGACGSAAEGEPEAAAPEPPASGAPEAEPAAGLSELLPGDHSGTYFVPVAAELEPFAAYPIESVRLDVSGSELRLSYDLPELLLGERRRVSFRGPLQIAGRSVLRADGGVATCQAAGRALRCDEVLSGLQRDERALERLLAELPEPEARGRRAVADQFSIDPIGVLGVELAD